MTEFFFEMVPPPPEPPFYADSENLGVPSCLRVVESGSRPFRCGQCNNLRTSPQVWVPDFATRETLFEDARTNAYNGHHTAWCLSCVRRDLGPPPRSWLARMKKALGIAP